MSDIRCTFRPHRRPVTAFTLVEILIVVVILGILAAITLPQFSNASQVARENTLKDVLRYMRTQIGVYKAQHNDFPPGYQSGVLSADVAGLFVDQLTQNTDTFGNCSLTASQVFEYGPYLQKMAPNPLTSDTSLKVVSSAAAMVPDNSSGWIYDTSTGNFMCNSTASDENGNPYCQY